MAKLATFTAKMQRPGQEARLIPNAILYKGYVAFVRQEGRGKATEKGGMFNGEGDTWTEWEYYEEVISPVFDGHLVNAAPADLKKTLQAMLNVDAVITASMEKYLLKIGEQDGYTVSNREEEKAQGQRQHEQQVADKKVPIQIISSYFGWRISERIPPADWAKIKDLAEYHNGDGDDMEWLDDMGYGSPARSAVRGWYYATEIVERLVGLGYTVKYYAEEVRTQDELSIAQGRLEEAKKVHDARVKEVAAKAAEYRHHIIALAREAGPCSKGYAAIAEKLPTVYLLNMVGADIYGGGAWLHMAGDDLYYVRNNGMDGDNWSYNNYRTGGAGGDLLQDSRRSTFGG